MHGGRLGIYSSPDGDSYFAQMRILKRSPSGSTTAQNPKEGELEDIIGWSLEDFLLESENIDQITTRGEYLGETGSGRSTPIAVWKEGGSRIPIIIYVATRLLPLLALDDML